MSLALVLAGLWEPHGTPLDWNPALNWQPIPYTFEELDKDTVRLVLTLFRFLCNFLSRISCFLFEPLVLDTMRNLNVYLMMVK